MAYDASKVTSGLFGKIPDAAPAELPQQHFYATSTQRSGVFHFDTEADRTAWCDETPGAFHLAPSSVDPDIRAEFGDVRR